jgi:pterin-4a-carbinolamine dehydratase
VALQRSTSEVQAWYLQVHEQSLVANQQHKELRKAIAMTRSVVMRAQMPLYPRSIKTPVDATVDG